MPAPIVANKVLALKLTPSGEKFIQISFLTRQLGIIRCMVRKKPSKSAFPIDLFDQGEAQIELKEGSQIGFLKSFEIEKSRRGIGSSYQNLNAASTFSKFVLANPLDEDGSREMFQLAEKTFDALETSEHANAILLKSIYLYSRNEGYPVIEDWAHNLAPDIRSIVTTILNTPLNELDKSADNQSIALDSLLAYLREYTHIHLT